MIFVGVDWAEAHHDVAVKDESGKTLAKRRLPRGGGGVGRFHALIADLSGDPSEVVVAIETDRACWSGAGRRWLSGVCDQPVFRCRVTGTGIPVRGQVGSRRRRGAGRSGQNRP